MNHFYSGLATVLLIVILLISLVSAQPSGVPTQDPSKVDIDPELESKFQDRGRLKGLFSTQEVEREEVMVGLEDYRGRPTTIEEMKSQASESQSPLLRMAENNPNVEVKNKFWIANSVLLEAPTNFPLENIASVQGVENMNVNAEVKALQSEKVSGSKVSPQASTSTYGLNQINATETWNEFGTRGGGVKVSVIDTGVDVDHDDIDLYTTDESDPTYPGGWAEFKGGDGDEEGTEPRICEHNGGDHGTHVSGTVSGGDASGTNIGVAPNVSLMNVGALMEENPEGDCVGSLSDIAAAMEWSVENDADILSMSLGAPGKYGLFIDTVRGVQSLGVIVIGASGNSGVDTSISPSNIYNATSVGASDSSGGITGFSSGEIIDTSEAWNSDNTSDWPSEYVVPDIAAPGENVYSSVPNNNYGYKRGTSMATPHVSGAAALMQSATYERLSPENISEAFVQTAWKPDDWNESSVESIEGQDIRYGHGIIDAYAATQYAIQKFDKGVLIENVTVNASEAEVQESLEVSGDVKNLGNEQKSVGLELKFNDSSTENKSIVLNSEESRSFQFEQSISEEGYYEVYVNGTFAGGLDIYMPDPEFDLTAQANESEIVEGESANISGIVNNTGGDGVADLRLLRNGSEIDQQNLNVSFESDRPYSFINSFSDPGYYSLSVNSTSAGNLTVLNDAELNLSDFTLNNSDRFFENDTIEASVNASNLGDVSGLFNISLDIDGSYDQSKEINLSAGSTQEVSFERVFRDRGNYSLLVGNLFKTLEVLREGSISITDGSVSNTTVVEGDQINYTAEFENLGDVQASDILEFQVDGSKEESRNVTAEKLSQNQTVFTRVYDTPGNYTLSVNSSQGRDIQVLNDAELNITGLSLSNSSIVEGENISANISAENIGDVSGPFTVPFNISGEASYSKNKTVNLDSFDEKNINFDQIVQDPGNYTAETFNYSKDFDVLRDANISLVNSSVNSTELFQGQTLLVNTTVENTGEVSGTNYLNYTVGELEKLSSTGEVNPGEKNLSETLSPIKSGNYSVKINSSNISDVEVKRPEVKIGNSSFNVSEKGIVKINTSLNNTDPGLVNESLEVSINNSNFSESYFLDKNEDRNVTTEVDWNRTGFYILKVNGSDIGNFTLSPYAEFSGLSPDGATFTEGEEIEYSGNVYSVGEPNLTVSTGNSEFELNMSSGLESFNFTESPDPGSYEWSAEASFSNSSFSSESLSYEVEEEEDDSGGGGSSGGSGGDGGFSGGGSFTSEVDLEVNESQNLISIRAPEGEYNLEFNETALPVKFLNFTSSQEGTVNFSSKEIDHNGSMESVFGAETDLDNSFDMTVEASNSWIEENNFNDSQISFFRYEGGWNNLDPEVEESDGSLILTSELESFSTFGVGADQACYSMEEVNAVRDGSCRSYSTICEVPEGAEVVDSCGSAEDQEREQQIRERIQEAREAGADEETLRQAETELEGGDIEQAEEILNQSSQTGLQLPSIKTPQLDVGILGLVSAGAVLLMASVFASVYLIYPLYREKRLVRRINGLTSKIKDKAQREEDIEQLARMVVRADEALIEENYDEAEKIIDDAERIK